MRELLDYAEKSRTPVSQISALLGMLNLTALVSILAAREGVPVPDVGAALAQVAGLGTAAEPGHNNVMQQKAAIGASNLGTPAAGSNAGPAGNEGAVDPAPPPSAPPPELATMLQLLLGNLTGPPGGPPPGPEGRGAAGSTPEKAAQPEKEPGEA